MVMARKETTETRYVGPVHPRHCVTKAQIASWMRTSVICEITCAID